MSVEKRSKNEFIGMSEDELQRQSSMTIMEIKRLRKSIVEKQKEIKALEESIKRYSNTLNRIKTAYNHTDDIETVNILKVWVKTDTEFKDPNFHRTYVYTSDLKSFLVFNFTVYTVNKQDYNKSKEAIYSTETDNTLRVNKYNSGFRASDKKELQKAIIKAIKKYNVVDVFFTRDVSLGKANIEKVLNKPVIVLDSKY